MKRFTVLVIILVTFAVLCQGQRRGRINPQTIIQLAIPRKTGQISFEEALNKQKDVIIFNNQMLNRNQVGQLAWAAMGTSQAQENLTNSNTSLQLYVATHEGLFIYQPAGNSLLQVNNMDIRSALGQATGQQMRAAVSTAGCSFIITAPTRKLAASRNSNNKAEVYLQSGHIAQNIQLQAICLDLGSVTINNFQRQGVNSACKLPRNIDPVYIISVGYPGIQVTPSNDTTANLPKKAALIVSSVNFCDQELFETLKALDAASVQRVIASTRTGVIRGMFGNQSEANVLVNQLKVDDYDAIIFIGGTNIVEYVNNSIARNLIREAFEKRKIIAASSTAPSILANAGILKGVKVTATVSEREVLRRSGALFTGVPVEQNMKIITSGDPSVAATFARAVTDAITGR